MHICMGKNQIFSRRSILPLHTGEGETPSLGASIIAPSALMSSPTKPENQTPPMVLHDELHNNCWNWNAATEEIT